MNCGRFKIGDRVNDWNPNSTENAAPLETIQVEALVRRGDRVRLRPLGRSDILDMALAGKIGIVESIEHDFDDKIHVAVVLEDDPGRDLGLLRQPGHRFFFAVDEIEPLAGGSTAEKSP